MSLDGRQENRTGEKPIWFLGKDMNQENPKKHASNCGRQASCKPDVAVGSSPTLQKATK